MYCKLVGKKARVEKKYLFFFCCGGVKTMPFQCGGLTKHKTKCRICVKEQGAKCRWHSANLGTCSICLEEVSGSEKKLEGCSHVFHSECILPWFVRCGESGDGSLTCPNCRAVVDDRSTVLWVGEHSSTSEGDDDDWTQQRSWRRLARVASEQRVHARRGLLEHIRGLFDRINSRPRRDDEETVA